MFRPDRALMLNQDKGKRLPRVEPALSALYDIGFDPREGSLIMIAGRSGSQKSGFAMWLAEQWGKPTLYFSMDMQPFFVTERLAAMRLELPASAVQTAMRVDGTVGPPEGRERVTEALRTSCITFAFGSQTLESLDAQIQAWVEVNNEYPPVIVIDNLMDLAEAEGDYAIQTEWMQRLAELNMVTGSTIIVLHHMRETDREKGREWLPGPRSEITNKLDKKPRLILSVALNPLNDAFNVAVVKQNQGKQDSSASKYATIQAIPEQTRFEALGQHNVTEVEV